MQRRKFRILSAVTAGSLALAVVAITASLATNPKAKHAALAAQTESFPPVNLDNCPILHTGYPTAGCVAQLQTNLNIIQGNHLVVDGIFGLVGSQTYNAVIAFQKAHSLPPDGIVGPATKQALDKALPVSTPAPPPSPAADAVDAKYQSLGGSTSFLGLPISPVFSLKNGGIGRHYQGGSIYWSLATGAHEVHGAIRDLWASTGWENGHLGMPISDETTGYNGRVRVSHFTGGDIYWTPTSGASEPLPAAVQDPVHAQGTLVTPPPPGHLEYSYDLRLDTTGYLSIPPNPDLAFKELGKCFNCTFPVQGAPMQFPAEGQYVPLNACHFIPLVNHLCQAPVTVYSNGRTFMRFTAQPGHFDGPGATITFTFYDGGGQLWMNVTGYVLNPTVPESVTRPGAHLMWLDFAANLDRNIWDDYCSHGC